MTAEELLRRLDAEATPGPWEACPYTMYVFGADGHMVADHHPDSDADPTRLLVLRGRGHGAEVSGRRPEGSGEANVRAIAALRTLLPEVIALVEAARDDTRCPDHADAVCEDWCEGCQADARAWARRVAALRALDDAAARLDP